MSAIWHRYTFPSTAARDAFFYPDIDVNQWVRVTGSPPITYQITSVSNGVATFSQIGGGGVTSFNSRTGAVVPASGDYTAAQVTNAVATSRSISTTAPVTGGGDLSADRTLGLTFAAPSQGIGGSNSAGSAASLVRSDHDHKVRETGGPTDLAIGAIADGQLVSRSGSSLIGTNVFGSLNQWLAIIPPASPHAKDDEFDGNLSAWTEMDPNNLNTQTTADGFLQMTDTSNGTNQLRGIYRAIPTESEWSVWAWVSQGCPGATFSQLGMFLAEDASAPTTKKFESVALSQSDITAPACTAQQYTNYNTIASTRRTFSWAGETFLRIGYDGTNMTVWASYFGITWYRIASFAKTFTPLHYGLFMMTNNGGTTMTGFVDFCRVKAATGASGSSPGLFRGRRA